MHAREKGKSARRVKELVEIESVNPGTGSARTAKVFVWLPADDNFEYRGNSWLLGRIAAEKGLRMNDVTKDIARRKKLLNWMVANNLSKLDDVTKYIRLYYHDPEKVDKMISAQMENVA